MSAQLSISPVSKAPAGSRDGVLGRLAERLRLLLEARGVDPVAVAFLESGEAERLVGSFADDAAATAAASIEPAGRPAIFRRRFDSGATLPALSCPVRDKGGGPLGWVVVLGAPATRIDRRALADVELIAELAALVLPRSAADGVERQLERAAKAVSGSLELEQVYRRIVQHAAAVTGASRALLTRFNARTGELRAEARVDFSDALDELDLDSGSFGHVARTREPLLRRRGEASGFDLGLMEREGVGALMHAPIVIGPRLYGVVSVAHEDPDGLGPGELELLVRFARSSAAALANAIDFERERRISRALTLGFVPEPLPDVPGFETGLMYAPSENAPTGGDVYGAWPVDGGLALLIGDVAGKGVETAALSSMVRFFVEARSWDTPSPARVLQQTNCMLAGRLPRDTFVTAFLAIIAEGELRFANAGHPPPLVAGKHSIRGLGVEPGLPLGVAESHAYRTGTEALAPGELLFAYTDGLVEARRGGEAFGAERLAAQVAELAGSHSADALVRAVHDEVADWADGLTDDAVALALRRSA